MTEPVPDTWSRYEYPILSAIARRSAREAANWSVRSDEILEEIVPADQPGERLHYERALVWLEEGGYIVGMTGSWGKPYPQAIMGITAEGRRAVGMWPNAETVADALLTRLSEEADRVAASNPEKGGRLKDAAVFLGSGARDIVVGVIGDVLAKTLGVK